MIDFQNDRPRENLIDHLYPPCFIDEETDQEDHLNMVVLVL